MGRLSKAAIKAHGEAVKLLAKDRLSDDEREFVLDNWQESANHVNSAAGAFFTPSQLGLSAALFLGLYSGGKVIDLCAGIGCLGLSTFWRWGHADGFELTCVEVNPAYVEVARLPFVLREHVIPVLVCEAEPHVIEDAVAAVEEAANLIETILGALEPFAKALGDIAGPDKDRWPDNQTIEMSGAAEEITWGDLRSARAVILEACCE